VITENFFIATAFLFTISPPAATAPLRPDELPDVWRFTPPWAQAEYCGTAPGWLDYKQALRPGDGKDFDQVRSGLHAVRISVASGPGNYQRAAVNGWTS